VEGCCRILQIEIERSDVQFSKSGDKNMAEIITHSTDEITIQVTVKLNGSMLDMEEDIQKAVNEVGTIATKEALGKFDASGAPIKIGDTKMTSKGKITKEYETPYGTVKLGRHVYQSSRGGAVYCPMDDRARIVVSSTPKFTQMISYKYTGLSSFDVAEDLKQNHGRQVTRAFVQDVADTVGVIALAREENWEYEIPKQTEPVATISMSLDGTCVLMRKDGYREAMTGNISLYDHDGKRLHTIYVGAAPEYGKQSFLTRLQQEIDKVKKKYPEANYVGIADGAKSNWEFLEPNTQTSILDFYHATEYLTDVSHAFSSNETKRREWLNAACHKLKHDDKAAEMLLAEMKVLAANSNKKKTPKAVVANLDKAIVYFTNQGHRMHYSQYRAEKLPIGSGVTEAACKTLIKQRLCRSGMQWKAQGAKVVIALRSLVQTHGRWLQFWSMINRHGLSDICLA
jgi:hypothetical protein